MNSIFAKILTPFNSSSSRLGGLYSQVHTHLNKIGKVCPKTVMEMAEDSKVFLRENTPNRLQELAKLNCYGAEKIKSSLDAEFGENNYVVIAVGRSVSTMAELLKYMGVDSKTIPLSGLRHLPLSLAGLNYTKMTKYKNYLKSIGITNKKFEENRDKKFVLVDYAYYGRSLQRTEELLKFKQIFGNVPNLITRTVNDLLGEDYKNKYYYLLFEYCRFKNFSTVGRLPIQNLEDVFQRANAENNLENQGNITKGLRKLFWFNVYDSFVNKTYKDCDPAREIESIFEHFLSSKAIRNRNERLQKELMKKNKQL